MFRGCTRISLFPEGIAAGSICSERMVYHRRVDGHINGDEPHNNPYLHSPRYSKDAYRSTRVDAEEAHWGQLGERVLKGSVVVTVYPEDVIIDSRA